MDEAVIQTDDDYAKKLMVTAATRPTSAAALIDSITRSQLEHALDAQRRGLKVYETGRFSPRLTNSGEVQLVVDGAPFEALPDAPPLVAGELSWLSDVAVLAHEHLGDPLETRTLPTDELDRRLRAIRVRHCGEFALTISGLEIPARGSERVHAVQDARITARELEVAGSAREDRKRRYRILYVPFVFDPTRWNVMILPNPAATKTRDQFRVVRSGSVRYRFEQR